MFDKNSEEYKNSKSKYKDPKEIEKKILASKKEVVTITNIKGISKHSVIFFEGKCQKGHNITGCTTMISNTKLMCTICDTTPRITKPNKASYCKDTQIIQEISSKLNNGYSVLGISHRSNRSVFLKMKCDIHGEYVECSKYIDDVYHGCKSCVESTSGIFYINKVLKDNTCIALKFGITSNLKRRIREQNKITKLQVVNIFNINMGTRAKGLENCIKNKLVTGILTKDELDDGYTETTSILNYSKIIELKDYFIDNHDICMSYMINKEQSSNNNHTMGIITKDNPSGYIGVHLNSGFGKENKKYKCRFIHNKKTITVLTHNDPKLCAIAHDVYIIDNKLSRNTNLSLGLVTQDEIDNFSKNILPKIGHPKSVRCMGSSGYVGVVKDGNSYRAVINISGKKIRIKQSKDPKACAQAYDKYIIDNGLDRPTNKSLNLIP